MRGNYSHDNHGSGMWTDINNIHTLYENNLVAHNTHIGITLRSATTRSSATTPSLAMGMGIRAVGCGGRDSDPKLQNVDLYGNRIDMTGGGNGVVLIQQNRGLWYILAPTPPPAITYTTTSLSIMTARH